MPTDQAGRDGVAAGTGAHQIDAAFAGAERSSVAAGAVLLERNADDRAQFAAPSWNVEIIGLDLGAVFPGVGVFAQVA